MPKKREGVLAKFRAALADGLQQWGVILSKDPWLTKQMTLLDAVKPLQRTAPAQTAFNKTATGADSTQRKKPLERPHIVVFVSVCSPRATQEDRDSCTQTCEALAQAFKSTYTYHTNGEAEALQYLERTLFDSGKLRDPDACMVYVCPDRLSRASRWLTAEALRRGVLPVAVRCAEAKNRQRLLAENVRFSLTQLFQRDPIRDIDIGAEVPAVKGKRVLVVGVDTCHTHDLTTGAVAGILIAPQGNASIVVFWRNERRGQEVEQVTTRFNEVVQRVTQLVGGLDECVVFSGWQCFQ